MASQRKNSGLGKSLDDIIAQQNSARWKPGPGYDEVFRGTGDINDLPVSKTPRTDRAGTYRSPETFQRSRVKPGIGEKGLTRIRESLAEFTTRDEEPELIEEPPEPPEGGDAEETEEEDELPLPEYIGPISQSTKRPGYGAKRPDNDPNFWGSGPTASTRVHGIQWIPVFRDGTYIVGDILVAFARPSSKQRASASGSLYVYGSKTLEVWETFKSSMSLGNSVNTILGSGTPFNMESITFYEGLHPGHVEWIFKEMGTWRVIRNPNEIDGGTLTEVYKERLTTAAKIFEDL